MKLARRVEPEWLDELPARDPGAVGSRKDLEALNRLMGHAALMARLLQAAGATSWMRTLVDLGAGDGRFMLTLARHLTSPRARPVKAVLVDRREAVSGAVLEEITRFGWEVETVQADVFDFLTQSKPQDGTVMIANLFLHHFEPTSLRRLLLEAALKSDAFAACEPRRSHFALAASKMVGLIGCNRVTRHDAPASVRAGFTGHEISEAWTDVAGAGWENEEGRLGLFSHAFAAWKTGRTPRGNGR
jgi:hypothetical protein